MAMLTSTNSKRADGIMDDNDEMLNTKSQLQKLEADFRSYVDEKNFDKQRFSRDLKRLKTRLSGVSLEMKKTKEHADQEPKKRLITLQKRFNSMKDCVDYWNYYVSSGDPGDGLLFSTNDFLVRISSLEDSIGQPSFELPAFARIVTDFERELRGLKEKHLTLRRLPFILQQKLSYDFAQAHSTLTTLKNIPTATDL
ncbi:hypothetical protein HF325_005745 [Metschnikowia pulcherrima]|uniref:Uncharacterized protein n=1 Tax=Metschnikowia pulcherrima TaxID=27326 RepID=A0A8H7GNS1_9ASCO|nr:hypothetical protein HF325_005745 [Metschnikowia pulcherrima]